MVLNFRIIQNKLNNEIGAEKSPQCLKLQWNAISIKYKAMFTYTTGNGTGEECVKEDARDWDLFEVMHEYAKNKHNYHSTLLISNRTDLLVSHSSETLEEVAETSSLLSGSPSTSEHSNTNSNKRKNKSERDINKLLAKEIKKNNKQ